MSNSPLVDYTRISPNKTSPRTGKIDRITIHHCAGVASVEGLGSVFAKSSRQASSNYGIGSDCRVGMYVEECDRSWCSSSASNDHRAITIEVSNSATGGDWPVSDAVLAKLIDLCTDICQRNGIAKLVYTGDTTGNMTLHRWFAATTCPGPYLVSKQAYIAEEVNKRLTGTGTTATFHTGNYYLSNSEMQDNALYIYKYLSARGWSRNAIAGLLGNFQAESTINPGIWQSLDEGDTSAGYGLVQWTPATKYLEWCSNNGLEPSHMGSALQRIEYELENGLQYYPTDSYPETFAEFKTSTKSANYLGMAFVTNYERPAEITSIRGTNAEYWYEFLGNYSPGTGGGGSGGDSPGTPYKPKEYKGLPLWLLLATRRKV